MFTNKITSIKLYLFSLFLSPKPSAFSNCSLDVTFFDTSVILAWKFVDSLLNPRYQVSFYQHLEFFFSNFCLFEWIALTFFISQSYTIFLTKSFFIILLSLLNSARRISSLSISNLSKSDFKLAKSAFIDACYSF